MSYERKNICQMNQMLEGFSRDLRIVVWGTGKQAVTLLERTLLLQFKNLVIADKYNYGQLFFGKHVVSTDEIDFSKVDVAVISSIKYEKEIEQELRSTKGFWGEIIKISLQDVAQEDELWFYGDFKSWDEAVGQCAGYGEKNILEKVESSIRSVLNKEAAYERDSVLFYEKRFSFHILAYIARLAARQDKITIVDFGGALGSTYLQNKDFLEKLPVRVQWYIVEQPNFVEKGNEIFDHQEISFFHSLDEISEDVDLILFSSVLGYLEDYEAIINAAVGKKARSIIIDRTFVSDRERICIERVPESIYPGSYALRIFQKEKLLNLFLEQYSLEYEFHSYVDEDIHFDDMIAEIKGFVFELK